jgi:hypothetical protein
VMGRETTRTGTAREDRTAVAAVIEPGTLFVKDVGYSLVWVTRLSYTLLVTQECQTRQRGACHLPSAKPTRQE